MERNIIEGNKIAGMAEEIIYLFIYLFIYLYVNLNK